MDQEIEIKRAWVEASVAELGRCLPGLVILISEDEVKNVQMVLERVLNDTWEHAQRPLLEALVGSLSTGGGLQE